MTRAEIIDIIKSEVGRVRFDSKAGYDQVRPVDTLANADFVTRANLPSSDSGVIATDILIPAGSLYPYNIVKGSDFDSPSLRPIVVQVIELNDTQDTTDGAGIKAVYIFTNDTKTVLQSIDVYTVTADGSTVERDTYVRVI